MTIESPETGGTKPPDATGPREGEGASPLGEAGSAAGADGCSLDSAGGTTSSGCADEAPAGASAEAALLGVGPEVTAAPRRLISTALRSEIVEYLQAFAIAVVLAAFIITFIAQSFVVEGSSMEPNLHNRERLLVNKIVYRFREPQRGDVVVFRYPANPRRKFIKRVIGVPGDVVEVTDGHVVLNGVACQEEYTLDLTFGAFGPTTVPEGRYFVMGDNRNNSDDSRFPDVGFVPKRNIVGKAFVTWWPPGKIGLVDAMKAQAIER